MPQWKTAWRAKWQEQLKSAEPLVDVGKYLAEAGDNCASEVTSEPMLLFLLACMLATLSCGLYAALSSTWTPAALLEL